jgi:hypothetical protein
MMLIQFPDRETEIKRLAVLMSRFSGKVLRGGLHIVPEPALQVLTAENIPYTVTENNPLFSLSNGEERMRQWLK